MKTNNENKTLDLLIVYSVCLLPKLYIAFHSHPAWAISDEVSAISVAALLAGYDWGNVVSNAGYYGFGFLFIFAPLFHIFNSPIWIYKIIVLVEGMLEALCSVVCYKTLSLIDTKMSRNHKCLISIICGTVSILSTAKANIFNEQILTLIVWLVVFFLVRIAMAKETGNMVRDEIVLLILTTYSLTLHSRTVMLYLALFALSVVYLLIWHKLPFHAWFYAVMTVGFFAIKSCIKLYQSYIWSNIGMLRNSSVSTMTSGFLNLVKAEGIDAYMIVCSIRIILGQLYTACVVTGGLFVLIVTAFLYSCFPIRKVATNDENKAWFIAGSFSFFCIIVTIFGQSLTWLPGVYHGTEYSMRALMYLRYFGIYVSPLAMCGLLSLVKAIHARKSIIKATSIGLVFLTLMWRWKIYPMLEGTWMQSDSYPQFSFLGQMKRGMKSTDANWLMASLLLFNMLFVLVFLFERGKEKIYMGLIITFLVVEQCYVYVNTILPQCMSVYDKGDAGYLLISQLDSRIHTDSFYVYDGKVEKNQIYYIYQYLNFRKHIIPGLPENEDWRFVFTNDNGMKSALEPCRVVKLDKNEYVFIRNNDDAKVIESLGYILQ